VSLEIADMFADLAKTVAVRHYELNEPIDLFFIDITNLGRYLISCSRWSYPFHYRRKTFKKEATICTLYWRNVRYVEPISLMNNILNATRRSMEESPKYQNLALWTLIKSVFSRASITGYTNRQLDDDSIIIVFYRMSGPSDDLV
jgi:hypothetical protein